MILCGASWLWLALAGLVILLAVFVVFSAGYICRADRERDGRPR